MTDKDVIRHLISVEQEADKVVEEAELEAEKKIAHCRNEVELRFKAECDKIIGDMDIEFNKHQVRIREERQKTIDAYSAQLECVKTDDEAAFSYLRKILFRGVE